LRAFPEAKTPLLQVDFSEIHRLPVVETSDSGNLARLIRVSVLAQQEVPAIDAVVHETIGLRAGIRERMFSAILVVQEALIEPHLPVMLVAKGAKFLARLGSRHGTYSGTRPTDLPSETVYNWNTLVPSNFGIIPRWLLSYAGGPQVSRAYSSGGKIGLVSLELG
jgi:hypothetical protein